VTLPPVTISRSADLAHAQALRGTCELREIVEAGEAGGELGVQTPPDHGLHGMRGCKHAQPQPQRLVIGQISAGLGIGRALAAARLTRPRLRPPEMPCPVTLALSGAQSQATRGGDFLGTDETTLRIVGGERLHGRFGGTSGRARDALHRARASGRCP
jgi:hypothetical protein